MKAVVRVGPVAIGCRAGAGTSRWTTRATNDRGVLVGTAEARTWGPFRIGRRWGQCSNAELHQAMRNLLPMTDAEVDEWERHYGAEAPSSIDAPERPA